MAFEARTTTHSFVNALALAQASGLAYASDVGSVTDGLAKAMGSAPLDLKVLAVPVFGTSLFIADFDEAVVVSFRGSEVLANWLTNAQILLSPFRGGGLVHFGFQSALDGVLAELTDGLDALAGKGRTLWLTGHSLGGALALLAAAYMRFPADRNRTLPRPIAGVYTFGQPRVGTGAFCSICDADFGRFYHRYVNRQDLVTRVPPRELAYWHIDDLEYITDSGQIVSDPAWWQVFLDRVKAGMAEVEQLRVAQPFIGLVADHSIHAYIDAISAQLAAPAPAKAAIPSNV